MRFGHKRYFVRYVSDQMICGSYDHLAGSASTLKSAKSIISGVKKDLSRYNPRHFRVYDSDGEIDRETNFVPVVCWEE